MPIYEYTCPCGNTFEKIRKMDDPNIERANCTKCRGVGKRIVSANSRQSDNWETKPSPRSTATAKKFLGGHR